MVHTQPSSGCHLSLNVYTTRRPTRFHCRRRVLIMNGIGTDTSDSDSRPLSSASYPTDD